MDVVYIVKEVVSFGQFGQLLITARYTTKHISLTH